MGDLETTEFSEAWKSLKIAIVGGDAREQQIARLAVASGAKVRAFGFPWPHQGIENVSPADSAEEALTDANIALLPIPGIAKDGSLFATEKIVPDRALLSVMASGAHIIVGKADPNLEKAAGESGITLHEYESDQELMFLRAPAIVEGVIRILIENTNITIHRSRVCVVGQGNIGTVLTHTLMPLGADVTVAARNPVQRAFVHAMGACAIPLDALTRHAGQFPILISSVPAPVVEKAVIDELPGDALVVDLSAPPGGVDLDYANATGRTAIWARGLGQRAPITVGASQWRGISKIIHTILEEVP